MIGYRCDNCHAFEPNRVNPDESDRVMFRKFEYQPDGWVRTHVTDDDRELHFCGHACLVEFAQREAEIR